MNIAKKFHIFLPALAIVLALFIFIPLIAATDIPQETQEEQADTIDDADTTDEYVDEDNALTDDDSSADTTKDDDPEYLGEDDDLLIDEIIIADEEETCKSEQVTTSATSISVGNASQLSTALSNTSTDIIINLTGSFTYSSPIEINTKKTITINLNGHTLNMSVTGAWSLVGIRLYNGAVMNVNGPGTLNVTSPWDAITAGGSGSRFNTSANATVNATTTGSAYGVYAHNGGYISITGSATVNGSNGIAAYASFGSTLVVGGNVTASGSLSDGVYAGEGSKVYISGRIRGGWHDIGIGTGASTNYFSASSPTRRNIQLPAPYAGNVWNEFTDNQSYVYNKPPTGWVQTNNRWYYYRANGSMISNDWEFIGGSWFYFNADGSMRSGWYHESGAATAGRSFYLGNGSTAGGNNTGAMRSAEWIQIDGKWYYHQSSGGIIKNGWSLINGTWYYLNADGSMRSGWYHESGAATAGRSFYLGNGNTANGDGSGGMRNGWIQIDGKWYYHQSSGGIIKNGWSLINGTWYYLNADGSMRSGWFHESGAATIGQSFYLGNGSTAAGNNTGGMRSAGWFVVDGKWYYHGTTGGIIKNTWWQNSAGVWFYFNADGSMRSGWLHESGSINSGQSFYLGNGNTAVGNNTGGMRSNEWITIDGKWYFHRSSGGIIKNDWFEWNREWYWFKSDGVMAANETLIINGTSRMFNANGTMVRHNDERIWLFFKSMGMSDFATAGILGNLYAESALRPNNLENKYEALLGFTDESYTASVDNGTYKNFINDSAGYGLAQWTFWTRKEALLNHARSSGTSIGELNMQLTFLWKELTTGYSSTLNELNAAKSVREASDIFMTQFERPADQSESAKVLRANYGQTYFVKFAS